MNPFKDIKSSPLSIALATAGTIAISGLFASQIVSNVKPIMRYEEHMEVLADNKTGDLFTWMNLPDGSKAFIKLDKKSESDVVKGGNEADSSNTPENIEPGDVRSGRIFKQSSIQAYGGDKYNFDAQIKYRRMESAMVYRVSVSPVLAEGDTCPSINQAESLKKFYQQEGSKLSLRFTDTDDFWVKDISILLDPENANNSVSTVIDSKKADCGRINEIVFHGRAPIKLPDFKWVDNGKLLFKNVKF